MFAPLFGIAGFALRCPLFPPAARGRAAWWHTVRRGQLSDFRHACMSYPSENGQSEIGQFLPLVICEQFVQVHQNQQLAIPAGDTLNVLRALVVTDVGR